MGYFSCIAPYYQPWPKDEFEESSTGSFNIICIDKYIKTPKKKNISWQSGGDITNVRIPIYIFISKHSYDSFEVVYHGLIEQGKKR